MELKGQLNRLLHAAGIEISLTRPGRRKSKRTTRLTFYETATGKYYLPTDAKGDHIAKAIRSGEVFDAAVFEVARKYVRRGTIALDVGSNFGQMAVLMAKLVDVGGLVYAFDADDFVFSVLEKNAKANASNIKAIFGAVHDAGGQTLYFPVQDFDRFSTYGSYGIDYVHGKGRAVPTIAIDEIDFQLPVSFMKVDVQGGDLFALRGARKTIEKHKMPIVFEYEYLFEEELGLQFQEYVDFVSSVNYRFAKVINGQNYLIVPR